MVTRIYWSQVLFSCRLCSSRLLSYSPSLNSEGRKRDFRRVRAKAKREIYRSHNGHNREISNPFQQSYVNNETAPVIQRTNKSSHNALMTSDSEMLFGIHPVYAALQTERRLFECLYMRVSIYKQITSSVNEESLVHKIYSEAHKFSLPVIPVNKSKLDKLATYGVHQGVILVTGPVPVDEVNNQNLLADVKDSNNVWMLINNVVDPMNLGALIRTAVYFGVDKIIMSPSCSKLSPVVSKASSGAMEVAPLNCTADVLGLLTSLKQYGWNIVGTSSNTDIDTIQTTDVSLKDNTLLIVGNESTGINKDILNCCTTLINVKPSVTCPPFIDSLNVSVAGAIVMSQIFQLKEQNSTQ